MTRQTTVILVLFVIVALSLGTLYLARKGAQLVVPPQKTPTIHKKRERQESKLEAWRVYQSEKYGYEIRYPDDLTVEEASLGPLFLSSDDLLSREDPDPHFHTYTMLIVTEETEAGKSLEEQIKERFDLSEFREFESSPEESEGSIDEIRSIRINEGRAGYFVHEWIQAYPVCHYLFKHKDLVIDLQGKDLKCKESSIFNQMLSTFRFLD